MVLIIPGLIGAAALAGNAHAFALASAATINALLQFGVGSLLIFVVKRSVSGRKTGGVTLIIAAIVAGVLVLCGMIVPGTFGIDIHFKLA